MFSHTSWRDDWRRPATFLSIIAGFAAIFGLQCAGFQGVDVEQHGDARIYRLSWLWFLIVSIPLVMMLVWAIAGLSLPSKSPRIVGGIFLFVAVGLACLIFPAVATCELILTKQRLSHTAGLAWAPDTRQVEFGSLSSIRIVRHSPDHRGFVLEFRGKNGQVTTIPKSTLLAAALPDLIANAREAQVPVETRPDRDSK